MAGEPLLVGVDFGTTNIKAVAFDPQGRMHASASVATPTHATQPGWAHYQPAELWTNTVAALRAMVAQLADPGRIVSVAVASIGETGVPLDRNGTPTYDAIAWFDKRTVPQAEWLAEQIARDELFAITGVSLQPIFSLCKLLWLRAHAADQFKHTVRWLNTADYIAFRLCGQQATDFSLASRMLALNLHTMEWSRRILDVTGFPADLFAPLRHMGTRLGTVLPEIAQATGLPGHTQVAVGGHDHICAALALGVFRPGTVLNSMGTTDSIYIPVDHVPADASLGRQGYTIGAHGLGGYYISGGLWTSGAAVDWFRHTVGGDASYATLIQEAQQAPVGSGGVYFLPHLRLADPPVEDPRSRGLFLGLNADVDRGMLFRATLEGLAYELRSYLAPLLQYTLPVDAPPESSPALASVIATGGGTRNQLSMAIKASVLNCTFLIDAIQDATAMGAALLGGLAAGIYTDLTDMQAHLHHQRQPILPTPADVAWYDRNYHEVFRHIYPAVRDLHHRIADLRDRPQTLPE